ncbi:MAG: hypothetical protein GWN45_02975, partial [Gammaproteobacteria bacterium]|nr:hypothetical protein [Gammaproteobacteria bacterium]
NDLDATVSPESVWYADTDGDGFGDPATSQTTCNAPGGHVPDGTDCDDTSSVTFPGAAPNDSAAACMKDADGDDWGDDTPPAGVTPGSDCNDVNAQIHQRAMWFEDADGDGFGNPQANLLICTPPEGYVLDDTDCDDSAGSAADTFPGAAPNDDAAACMKDVDGDDYGDDTPPAGVTAGTDCDDTDPEANAETMWYRDQDQDGFGDPGESQLSCSQPAGNWV